MKTFEQFRAELADAATVAINSGVRIGIGDGCPLSLKTCSYVPGCDEAAQAWDICIESAREFIAGYDTKRPAAAYYDGRGDPVKDTPFFRLGRLYRERFVK